MSKETEPGNSRFPDFGPCNIKNWKGFLEKAKEKFNENWENPLIHEESLNDFHQEILLGSGSFGKVVLIKHKQNGKYFAMKAIEKEKIIRNNHLGHLKNEKMVLKSIDFPMTVYLAYFFKDNSYIYFIMPFIPGGELFTHLTMFGGFKEDHAKFYISQVILALEYLHYLDLVYRDLKPENILIDHTGYLKVTDFGFCKRLRKSRLYTLCGTPEYLAPEVILNKGYGKSVDWWCVGVLAHELVAGYSPFFASEPMRLYEKIVGLKYQMPSSFSSELKDLVKNILQVDLSRRYGNLKKGVEDIKGHKWFRVINWMTVLNRTMKAPYRPKYKHPGDTRNFETTSWSPLTIASKDKYEKEFADF